MRKVITYGTFDMLHHGHVKLLERAKALGDYFIVGITSDSYDQYRGKLNIADNLAKRIENVQATGLADEIIVEEYEGQKIDDIVARGIDIFAIGSDWLGDFDYLNEYCEVVYLERTRGISSTDLRNKEQGFIRFGLVGAGKTAHKIIAESKFVSGIAVEGVLDPDAERAQACSEEQELAFGTTAFAELMENVDAVHFTEPWKNIAGMIKAALEANKHVLYESPQEIGCDELAALHALAEGNGLVLMESMVTQHCPGFKRLVSLAKSGRIGEIKHIDISYTHTDMATESGGSLPLLPVYKLLGFDCTKIAKVCQRTDGTLLFAHIDLIYKKAMASIKVGGGIKANDSLTISGTRGYLNVPAPWWRTDYFELTAVEDETPRKFFYEFLGDGFRYVLVDFAKRIAGGGGNGGRVQSEAICDMMQRLKQAEGTEIS